MIITTTTCTERNAGFLWHNLKINKMTNSIIFNGHQITDFTMDETGRFEVPANYYPPTTDSAVRQIQEFGVLAYNSTSKNDLTDSITISGVCQYGDDLGRNMCMKVHIPNASENDFDNEMFASYNVTMIVENEEEFETVIELFDWLQVKQDIAKHFVQEKTLHTHSVDLMDELDAKYKIDSRLSLCEYYVQHKHKMSTEDKHRISDLIEMF
jgi:hypothetical protein|tara:strand:- start:872 stop:1504 length:633 start_codon:yes stop_codon:yes gene_type:complete